MKARRMVFAFVALCLLSAPAGAQEQRGAIQGTVRDDSGGILPGALIELTSPSLVAGASATTDSRGAYSFPALPPGIYEVKATLQSFAVTTVPKVELALGRTLRVDLVLQVGTMKESVTVSGAPLIDISSSAVATSIVRKDFDNIPKGRDFLTIAKLAPGANDETKLGGLSIDGASGAENVFYVDGLDVTNLTTGVSGKSVLADLVEEVQVKSSGYDAEYGGAIGGVINVVTRSGSNRFTGEGNVYFTGDALQAKRTPTLRLGLTNSNIAETVTYPKDDSTQTEPGFMLGGPILRDRVWFFGGYFPQLARTDRTVTFTTTGQTNDFEQKKDTHYVLGKLTAQFTPKLRGAFSVNMTPSSTDGQLPNLAGTDSPLFPFTNLGSRITNRSYSGNLDILATRGLYLNVRAGHFLYDERSIGVPDELRYVFNSSNLLIPGIPDNLRRATGFSSVPTNSGITRDEQTRLTFNTDATYEANFAGQHTLKGGFQFTRLGIDMLSGNLQDEITLFWNQAYTARSTGLQNRGEYGYYSHVQNAFDGKAHSDNYSLFLQDSWRPNRKLTINAGLRSELEHIPGFREGEQVTAIIWSFLDKLAPRFGATYDVRGDGKWKVFGNYGKFYDIMKLSLARNAFGGAKRLTYFHTLDTFDWLSLNPNNYPGRFVEVVNGRPDRSGAIDPDIEPVQSREFALGLEHELGDRLSFGVRYIRKQLLRTIEDTGWVGASGSTEYIIGNPGFGQTVNVLEFSRNQGGFPAGASIPRLPEAQRDYDAIETRFTKRFADRWSANVSYTWSRLFGNYTGLVASDELGADGSGRLGPNGTGSFDQAYNVFGPNDAGQCCSEPISRHLPTDRPHQFKAQAVYLVGRSLVLGANQYVASGTPVLRAFWKTNAIFYGGDLSDGRTPTLSQTDLSARYEFRLPGTRRFQLALNVLNLFDQRTETAKYFTINKTSSGVSFTDPEFFNGQLDVEQRIKERNLQYDPRFLQSWFWQTERSATVSARFLF
ncbi:MAG: TonB-dependent receptor [Acidobacteria bacterium]|nr:TonB-dependent receptor [Acidobacteriota bacterium]